MGANVIRLWDVIALYGPWWFAEVTVRAKATDLHVVSVTQATYKTPPMPGFKSTTPEATNNYRDIADKARFRSCGRATGLRDSAST